MKRSQLLSTNQQFDYQQNRNDEGNGLERSGITLNQSALDLIVELCQALEEEGIDYCHWKSNNALERSASGDNDLDLLISRTHSKRFADILNRLGFIQAEAPSEKWMPGVLDFYGNDTNSDKFVHVHAHYQLIAGHDLTKNYSLPNERAYLESAVQSDLFRVPAPEFEFIIFVIRMILKHSTWDVMLIRDGELSFAEKQEFDYLLTKIDMDLVNELLKQHYPFFTNELFDRCLKALQSDFSFWERIQVGQRVQQVLKPFTRRTKFQDIRLKIWRKLKSGLQRRLLKRKPKRRLSSGGFMIAVVGGDGAGKSTAVNSLYSWLSKDFETLKVHLGRPDWSLATISLRGILKIGRVFGIYPHFNSSILYQKKSSSFRLSGIYPWMLREVCKARDRYLTYMRANRFAINGGFVICDRFPLPQIKLMDGAAIEQIVNLETANRFSKYLIKLENRYYKSIVPPELILVLRVNPEIAVQRKTDEDPLGVKIRSTEIWEIDWRGSKAHVIDGHESQAEVLSRIKSLIWSEI